MTLKERIETLQPSKRPHLLCEWERDWLRQMANCQSVDYNRSSDGRLRSNQSRWAIGDTDASIFKLRMRGASIKRLAWAFSISQERITESLDKTFLVIERCSLTRKWANKTNRQQVLEILDLK